MYAIFEDGSHQFRVREGDRVRVDRRDGKAGDELVFSKVLLITEQNGNPTIGTPAVDGGSCGGEDHQSIQGEEDHHPERTSARRRNVRRHAAIGHRQPYHHGSDHERARSSLIACFYSLLKI